MKNGNDRSLKSTNVRFLFLRAAARLLSVVAPRRAEALAVNTFLTPIRRANPRVPEVPGQVAHAFRFQSPAGDLQVWDWGSGPTVLLVHGWNGSASQMAPFVAPLVAAGFYVVAFDQPAHGRSSGSRASLVDMANAVAALGKRLGPVAGVIAHSLGAPASAIAMSQGLRVERSVFVAPPLQPSPYFQRLTDGLGLSPERARAARDLLASRVGRTVESLDMRQLAAQAKTRLLVIHDKDDAEVSWNEGAAVAEAWSGRITTLHGQGHVKLLRNPAVVAEAVSFFSRPKLQAVRQSA